MAVKLYRCSNQWAKIAGHPCWKVEKALMEAGIEYERVPEPWFPRSKRVKLMEATGQNVFPAIQFEDGSVYKEESKDMAETIRAGRLREKQGSTSVPSPSPS